MELESFRSKDLDDQKGRKWNSGHLEAEIQMTGKEEGEVWVTPKRRFSGEGWYMAGWRSNLTSFFYCRQGDNSPHRN